MVSSDCINFKLQIVYMLLLKPNLIFLIFLMSLFTHYSVIICISLLSDLSKNSLFLAYSYLYIHAGLHDMSVPLVLPVDLILDLLYPILFVFDLISLSLLIPLQLFPLSMQLPLSLFHHTIFPLIRIDFIYSFLL
jgi:hypothetical protein